MSIEEQLWQHMQLPLFDIGKDGFPRPGKVSRHYREQRKQANSSYTQQYLATLLSVSDQWIWEIEHNDRGMDSISLRRKLAKHLDIPLVLFALSSLEDESELGRYIKSQRKMLQRNNPLRTQQGLAKALGVTEKAVREMENYNKGLDSLTRRRMLTNLLKLPSAVLGIVTLEELISQYQIAEAQSFQAGSTAKRKSIDIKEYRNALSRLWGQNHTGTVQNTLSMQEMNARITRLSAELAYVGSNQEQLIRDTLCRYLQLHAHTMRDQGQYDSAIVELEQAVLQAEIVGNIPLLAATLFRLGSALYDRGDIALALSHIDTSQGNSITSHHHSEAAKMDFQAAIGHYTRIRSLKSLPNEISSAVLLALGNTKARVAYGDRDAISNASTFVEEGRKIIKENKFENDEFGIKPNMRRYYSTKAATFLAVGWPREALDILTNATSDPSQGSMARMNAYSDLLWAQAYADTGKIEAAATLAQDTLTVLRDIRSTTNISRIAGLHGQLSSLDSSNIEVIRLGVMLKG